MAVTELKRYTIHPDAWADFIAVWQRIVAVRRRHGFGILFAFEDLDQNLFTWAIDHPGDFDAAAQAYYADPERVDLEVVNGLVSSSDIRRVDPVALPG